MGIKTRTVYAGTCVHEDTLVCGVVENNNVDVDSWCDKGSWEPPHVVAHSGHPHRRCAYYPDTMVIGRCDGPDGPCSNLASRCADPLSFVVRDPDCRITQDYKYYNNTNNDESTGQSSTTGIKYTTYGRCGERCVWSPDDCLAGEDYVTNDMECTANKVQLGACLDGFGYCTVSSKTCVNVDGSNTAEPYYTHDDFLEKFQINCYLADLPKPPPPPTIAPLPTTAPPTTSIPISSSSSNSNGKNDNSSSSSRGGKETSSAQSSSSLSSSSSSSLSQNVIIIIVIVIALLLGIAVGFVVAKMHSKKERAIANNATNKQHQQQEIVDSPPMTVVGVNSNEIVVDADEELSLA